MNLKMMRYMEIAWIVIGVAGAVVAAYEINRVGFDDGKQFLFLPAVAGLVYLFRRGMRKRIERNMDRD